MGPGAMDVEALLLYGYAKSNLSFHGGTLCVNTPMVDFPGRVALNTGSPPCMGILKSNMNMRIQSGVDPMLTAGAQVYAPVAPARPQRSRRLWRQHHQRPDLRGSAVVG